MDIGAILVADVLNLSNDVGRPSILHLLAIHGDISCVFQFVG